METVKPKRGNNPCIIFVGRFQPFTLAHQRVVLDAWNQHKLPVMVVRVEGKNRNKKSPFGWWESALVIHKSLDFKDLQYNQIVCGTAYIGHILERVRLKNFEPKFWYAGSDRLSSYEKQLKLYSKQLNCNIKLINVYRSEISATKVREVLLENDFKAFQGMVSENIYGMFGVLRNQVIDIINI